jgi:hypothetical protein
MFDEMEGFLDEAEDDDYLACVCCSCLIGDEVAYGDNWGEGPMCANCTRVPDEDEENAVDIEHR